MSDGIKNRTGWYHYTDPEWCDGPYPSREEAIEKGRAYNSLGETFTVCHGTPFRNQIPNFHDWVSEAFDDVNEEYAGENYASGKWKDEHYKELIAALERTMDTWLDRHGYRGSWALDCTQEEVIKQ